MMKQEAINKETAALRATLPRAEVAETWLHEYGSPLYVYDAEVLRRTIARITRAVPYPQTHFHFASVTNGNIELLQIIRACGWGLHANTPGDVYLALQAGFAPEQIVYSGSNLNLEEMRQMLDWRVATLNFDSVSQLQRFCEVYQQCDSDAPAPRLGFRLNLPHITGETRIGVRPAEFPDAIGIAARVGLRITGIHFYRGTGTNLTAAFTEAIADVLEAGSTLPDWQYLDFGGGFGYPYRAGRESLDWEVFGAALSEQLLARQPSLSLLIEPGRAAIAGSGILLARVQSVKWQDEKQIIGVDTTIANIAVLSVHGGYRSIRALSQTDGGRVTTDVCGNTTFSRDYLGRGCLLPAMQPDDIVAILDVGAYGYAMASHFLHRPRPAEILIDGGEPRLIRRRESYAALTKQV